MIRTSIEPPRGCGYRKKGGKYLIGGNGPSIDCCKLPFEISICPCCGQGIKPTRGFTWITSEIFRVTPCENTPNLCPLAGPAFKMGLLWVGEKYYPDTRSFDLEANQLGISRRISQLPRGLAVGDWIALAHRKAISKPLVIERGEIHYSFRPGIFRLFKLQSIEYVITGSETPEELETIQKKGFSLVKVIPDTEAQQSLNL